MIMTQPDAGIFPAKSRRASPDDDEPLTRSIAIAISASRSTMRDPRD
jgi:hypothetical protein